MSDSPFFYHGPITPREIVPWEVMHWHRDIITEVLSDLDRVPPEYVAVFAPAMGGKTTFAHQLMNHTSAYRPGYLFVYADLTGLTAAPGTREESVEIKILRRICTAFSEPIGEILPDESGGESGAASQYLEKVSDAIESIEPLDSDDLENILRRVISVLDGCTRVVLVLDGIEYLPREARQVFCNRLRAIYANRLKEPLSKFSTILLAESLRASDGFVSPLVNLVKKYKLPAFSRDDLRRFLSACGEKLGGVVFEEDAIAYLCEQTGGHPALIQKICQTAMCCDPIPGRIGVPEILDGIAQCIEGGGGTFARMLDMSAFDEETKPRLAEVLRKAVVLYHTFDSSVARLADAGIVREGPQHRCEISSPLVQGLFLKKFRPPHERLPRLSEMESILVEMPQFLSLLINEPLFDRLCEVLDAMIKQTSNAQPPPGQSHQEPGKTVTLEDVILAFLNKEQVVVDEIAIQFMMRRYRKDTPPGVPSRQFILNLVARIYAVWYGEKVVTT